MNALYSEVPGAPNYNEEGFRSMFYHDIDEPVLPNQRPSDIGLATKYGLERSGLYFAAKFYDLEAFKKSWKRIPTSVQDKLKRAKEDGGYGLDIHYLKSFFSGANHFVRRSDLFKLFLKHKKIGKEQLRGDIQNAILATTKKSERRRLKKQLADMSDEPTSEECSSDGSDRPSPKNCSKGYSSSRGRHHSSSSHRRHSDSDESDGGGARHPPRPSKSMKKKHSSSSRRRCDSDESDEGDARRPSRPSKAGSDTGCLPVSASQTYHTEALRTVDPSVLDWAMRTPVPTRFIIAELTATSEIHNVSSISFPLYRLWLTRRFRKVITALGGQRRDLPGEFLSPKSSLLSMCSVGGPGRSLWFL